MGHSSVTTAPSTASVPEPSHRGIHIPLPHVHLPGHGTKETINRTDTKSSKAVRKEKQRQSNYKLKSSANGARPIYPNGLDRQNSVQTRYMDMLLALDTIPRLHTILAAFFTWILLAGFIIFPGTFTALGSLQGEQSASEATQYFFKSVKNVPLLVIAGVCCGIGVAGMLWLWWTWRKNYVWLLNKIFLPGCLNSLAGVISTLINVYTQQDHKWSITARVTVIVAGSIMLVTALLFVLYNFWVLDRVKRSHARDMHGRHGTVGDEPQGIREKLQQPALEPGSVV